MRASIITPTYNARDFIESCILNVAAQGDAVLEHIIVDGGSTDGTLDTVDAMLARFPHLRLLPGPDRGQSDAMNKGSAAARGEVIGILNVDDYYEPGAVAEGVARLAAMERPALVVGVCRIIDDYHNAIVWNRPEHLAPEYLLQDSPHFPIPANPSAYFYHAGVHALVGGYDVEDSLAMDLEFLLTCAERVECRFVDRHWGNFRLMPGCKTYENIAHGPALVTSIIKRHRRQLSLWRRGRMACIMLERRLRLRAWHLLRRIGLR